MWLKRPLGQAANKVLTVADIKKNVTKKLTVNGETLQYIDITRVAEAEVFGESEVSGGFGGGC